MLNVKIGLSYKNNQKEILPPDIYILFMQNSDIALYFPALLLNIKKKKKQLTTFLSVISQIFKPIEMKCNYGMNTTMKQTCFLTHQILHLGGYKVEISLSVGHLSATESGRWCGWADLCFDPMLHSA